MDFELKGFYLKLDYSQSPISSQDRQDRALVYRERTVISVSHKPRERASGFTYPRWPPVTQSLRSRRSYGKIGNCESNDERYIWWIGWRTQYDWDVSQVQVQVNFALPKLVQYKMAYRISRLTNDESKYTLFFFFFYKNIFYKNIEAEICEILRIL